MQLDVGSGITVSLGVASNIVEFNVTNRVLNQNTGLYTCPASKKAKVVGSMNLDAVGGDTSYALAVLRGGTFTPIGAHVVTNGISVGQAQLDAGDIYTAIGDAGSTNGTCDMNATVQEVPV